MDLELKAMIEGKDDTESKGKVKSESLGGTSHGEPSKSKKGKDSLPGATSENITTTKIEFHKMREFVIRNGAVLKGMQISVMLSSRKCAENTTV